MRGRELILLQGAFVRHASVGAHSDQKRWPTYEGLAIEPDSFPTSPYFISTSFDTSATVL